KERNMKSSLMPRTPSLFDPPSGDELALEGAKVVSTNDRRAAEQIDLAIKVLANEGLPFDADDVRDILPSNFQFHPNLIGARFLALSRVEQAIEPCGFKKSSRPTRRGGVMRLWRKKR